MSSSYWRKIGLYLGLVDPYGDDYARQDRADAEKTVTNIVLFPLAAALTTAAIIGGVRLVFGSSTRSAVDAGVAWIVVVGGATIIGGFVRRRRARRRL
jgi:hypothetical protein